MLLLNPIIVQIKFTKICIIWHYLLPLVSAGVLRLPAGRVKRYFVIAQWILSLHASIHRETIMPYLSDLSV